MPRSNASLARQCERGVDHAADFAHEELRRAVDTRNVTGHRSRIASVTFEIEGDRDIPGPRQCQGVGFHELSRAGEAVCDDDHWSFRASYALIDCGRCLADQQLRNRKARALVLQLHNSSTDA
jgi:hypothetical protein